LINDLERLRLPQSTRPSHRNSNYTSCLFGGREELEFMGNVSECSEDQSFEEVTNKTTLAIARADVWWYCGGPLRFFWSNGVGLEL
jgi:hypothetical protein